MKMRTIDSETQLYIIRRRRRWRRKTYFTGRRKSSRRSLHELSIYNFKHVYIEDMSSFFWVQWYQKHRQFSLTNKKIKGG